MSDLEKYLYKQGLSNSSVKSYYTVILHFIAWMDGQQIEPEQAMSVDITAYIQYLRRKKLANTTLNLRVKILRTYFDYQIEKQQREDNPAKHIKIRGVKRQKLYPLFTKEELESLYHQYQVPTLEDERKTRNWFIPYRLSKQRNKAIIGLMIWQGLTTPEINKLALKDVKLREGKIYIAGSRKSAERALDLKPQQILELMEYQQITRNELLKYINHTTEEFFISSPPSGKISSHRSDALHVWKRLSEELRKQNPKFINFKQVRTSVITHWLAENNLRMVQYLAGHKYVSTTETYLVNQVEDLQADIEQFHPIG
jgi:site-specific recombinase XerD